jgi:hypothetical protein
MQSIEAEASSIRYNNDRSKWQPGHKDEENQQRIATMGGKNHTVDITTIVLTSVRNHLR